MNLLPPYSPGLNEVEPVFRRVKYHAIPERSQNSDRAGFPAIEVES
jgi:hypothetical protein